jgi:DNA-binding MarR family transcriptional regulator
MIPPGTACCETLDCDSGDCLQLTPREEVVCSTVCHSGTPISFSMIKERSGLHQEVLSRILRRLSVYGALEKVDGKYRRRSVNKNPEDE